MIITLNLSPADEEDLRDLATHYGITPAEMAKRMIFGELRRQKRSDEIRPRIIEDRTASGVTAEDPKTAIDEVAG